MTKWRILGGKKDESGTMVYSLEQAQIDILACYLIHEQQIERYGKDVVGDMPKLTEFPVWLAMVAERDGKVVDLAYWEMNLEFCMGGTDARAAVALRRTAPGLIQRFKKKGFRLLRTFIPRQVERPIGKELTRTGFQQQDKMYAHFLLDLR